jgi:hypothetical protein
MLSLADKSNDGEEKYCSVQASIGDKRSMVNHVNDSLKVQILLHEYDTLRTEVIHRINNVYQVLALRLPLVPW